MIGSTPLLAPASSAEPRVRQRMTAAEGDFAAVHDAVLSWEPAAEASVEAEPSAESTPAKTAVEEAPSGTGGDVEAAPQLPLRFALPAPAAPVPAESPAETGATAAPVDVRAPGEPEARMTRTVAAEIPTDGVEPAAAPEFRTAPPVRGEATRASTPAPSPAEAPPALARDVGTGRDIALGAMEAQGEGPPETPSADARNEARAATEPPASGAAENWTRPRRDRTPPPAAASPAGRAGPPADAGSALVREEAAEAPPPAPTEPPTHGREAGLREEAAEAPPPARSESPTQGRDAGAAATPARPSAAVEGAPVAAPPQAPLEPAGSGDGASFASASDEAGAEMSAAALSSGGGPSPRSHPAAAAPHVLPQPDRGTAEQLATAISRREDGDLELRLDPPELGRVKLVLGAGEHGLTATVTAERPDVADLMRRHADLLERALSDAGHKGAELRFGAEGDGDRSRRPSPEAFQQRDPAGRGGETLSAPVRSRPSGGLDIRV